jgi:hypothetical protein
VTLDQHMVGRLDGAQHIYPKGLADITAGSVAAHGAGPVSRLQNLLIPASTSWRALSVQPIWSRTQGVECRADGRDARGQLGRGAPVRPLAP